MDLANVIIISSNSNASSRTKNRIRENGPEFEFMASDPNPVCLGEPGILVSSVATDWEGWLPVSEVDFIL